MWQAPTIRAIVGNNDASGGFVEIRQRFTQFLCDMDGSLGYTLRNLGGRG
jgi:hypothetical protein